MKKIVLAAIGLILVVGVGAPYVDADFARAPIERALERGLGRRVEVGKIRFNLFTGPGFTVEDVTIFEDPRAGIEPFAYVGTLEARARLLSLFSRRLEFSSLRLVDASINLVKTDAGPWNFQFLLGGAPAVAMPSIKMRSGRVNFKFGDTKSVFYFNDADLDVSPSDHSLSTPGPVELRFSGAPSRTDQAQQNFGHFFVRGTWSGQQLDMKVELERSALDEVTRLFDRHGLGVHGIVAFDAQISGFPSNLQIAGQLQVDDIHRWDLLPKRGGGWRVDYKGTLDLHGERLDLASTSDTPSPLELQFRAADFLSRPRWEAAAELKQIPLATLVEVARHMGAALSDKLAAEGTVSGEVRYSAADGLAGRVELQDASVTLPDAQPLKAASAAVTIADKVVSLETSAVRIGENESAEVEGSFDPAAGLDLKIATRGLSVADLRSFGLAAIPLLEQTPSGTWRGWARYRWGLGNAGGWSGEYELQNARITIPGLADPVRIQAASVSSNGARITVSKLRAKIGTIAFTGDYRWEPAAVRPHKFNLVIPEADAAEVERLLAPALVRERGFLSRALRLSPAPVPEWLRERRADGTVSIGSLKLGDSTMNVEGARVLWDGALVRFARLSARMDTAAVNGELDVDLSGHAPHYRFDGKVLDVAYKGGKLDFEGSLDADGSGMDLIAGARAEGRVRGRSIAFAPDADFRTLAGCFEMMAGLRVKISGLEVVQGGETYTGSGATQADGRMVVDLTNRGRQIRYTSAPAMTGSQ